MKVPDGEPLAIPPSTPISRIFDERAGTLLILGAPGTAKTTLLLELCRDLLERADRDNTQPIPVVFPLYSWAAKRQRLVDWLISELTKRSDVPKKTAHRWFETEQILPLLDGLDEVATQHREACVGAINEFRREYGLVSIAVCSRIADYEALGTKLRLQSAVQIGPLTRSQVTDYLTGVGEPMRALHAAIEQDSSLWELLETPLMLWVAMLASRDMPPPSFRGNTVEQQQRRLFAHFVEAMLKRKTHLRYRPEQTKRWLSWLACALARNNRTIFYVGNLDFDLLGTRTQRFLTRIGFFSANALLSTMFACIVLGLLIGVLEGVHFGLLAAHFARPRFAVQIGMSFGWHVLVKIWGLTAIVGAFITPAIALSVATIDLALRIRPLPKIRTLLQIQFWTDSFYRVLSMYFRVWNRILSLYPGSRPRFLFELQQELERIIQECTAELQSISLLSYKDLNWDEKVAKRLGPAFLRALREVNMAMNYSFALSSTQLSQDHVALYAKPNEETTRSLKLGLTIALLSVVLIESLALLMNPFPARNVMELLVMQSVVSMVEVSFAILGGMLGGGLLWVKHYSLRLFLSLWRCAPLNYLAFLAECKDLLFLRQVGRGYMFTHDLVPEYFASLTEADHEFETRPESAAAVGR